MSTVLCDHCKWCVSHGCNEHEDTTGPYHPPSMSDHAPSVAAPASLGTWVGKLLQAANLQTVQDRGRRIQEIVREIQAEAALRAESVAAPITDAREALEAVGVPGGAFSIHGTDGERSMVEGLNRLAARHAPPALDAAPVDPDRMERALRNVRGARMLAETNREEARVIADAYNRTRAATPASGEPGPGGGEAVSRESVVNEIGELIAVGLLSQSNAAGLTAVQADEIGKRVARTLRPSTVAALRPVVADAAASEAHEFRAHLPPALVADFDAVIWRIHDALRPPAARAEEPPQ